jgi:AraC-like ligand binding domain
MMLLGPGVTAATTAKRRNAVTCSVVVDSSTKAMRSKQTRSAFDGLERSCQDAASGWITSTRRIGGVELFSAWFAGEAYQKHRHDTYAIGVTDAGVQVFDYRGAVQVSTPGRVIVLHPDESHDGRAGTADGFAYRILYIEPGLLGEPPAQSADGRGRCHS